MPDENKIIYCVQVDNSGRMVNSHMITTAAASRAIKKVIDPSNDGKENI